MNGYEPLVRALGKRLGNNTSSKKTIIFHQHEPLHVLQLDLTILSWKYSTLLIYHSITPQSISSNQVFTKEFYDIPKRNKSKSNNNDICNGDYSTSLLVLFL